MLKLTKKDKRLIYHQRIFGYLLDSYYRRNYLEALRNYSLLVQSIFRIGDAILLHITAEVVQYHQANDLKSVDRYYIFGYFQNPTYQIKYGKPNT